MRGWITRPRLARTWPSGPLQRLAVDLLRLGGAGNVGARPASMPWKSPSPYDRARACAIEERDAYRLRGHEWRPGLEPGDHGGRPDHAGLPRAQPDDRLAAQPLAPDAGRHDPGRHSRSATTRSSTSASWASCPSCDVAAISSYSAQIKEAYELADRYRAAGVRVVLGGLHVTAVPDGGARACRCRRRRGGRDRLAGRPGRPPSRSSCAASTPRTAASSTSRTRRCHASTCSTSSATTGSPSRRSAAVRGAASSAPPRSA